jgi:hypothetical protein
MKRRTRGEQPVWPPHLAEFRPEDWDCKLSWHWARYHANRDQQLGFDSLPLLQAVAAATVDPDCKRKGQSRADG